MLMTFFIMIMVQTVIILFAYEPALKYSFEISLLRKMKSCGDIVRYEHCDRKEKQFRLRYYQMVTHPSTTKVNSGDEIA